MARHINPGGVDAATGAAGPSASNQRAGRCREVVCAYVPQPAPNYVPAAPPQPRLRDRIIERMLIINRFHEPQ